MTLLELTPRVPTTDRLTALPVAIVGAGPVGLAAAANLAERGIDFVILEAGSTVGSSIRLWGHVPMFSPWRYLVDPASRRLLEASGWRIPAEDRAPTGGELVTQYLEPLAALDEIGPRIRFGTRVVAVAREGMDRTRTAGRDRAPFVLRVVEDGVVSELSARAVIDASGTYLSPNPLGSTGLDPIGWEQASDAVTHALPDVTGGDRERFAGRRVTVVGAGHSAANTLIRLAELAVSTPTRVAWLIRNRSAVRVSSDPGDELPDRARLGSRVDRLVADGVIELIDSFEIGAVEPLADGGVRLVGTRRGEPASHETDVVVNATGFRPDLAMLREVRLDLDDIVEAPRLLAPLIDPNVHSCGTVEPHGFRELTQPERGFFLVGMKSYGRAPTFLLATGYEQVRSVTAWLAGDMSAASAVALTLPATGVCSTDQSGGGCCS